MEGVSEIRASLTEDGKIPECLVHGFRSKDPQTLRTAVTTIRKILQIPGLSAIQPFIDTGLVSALVSLLDSDDTSLQYEATWIVTNIASGTTEQTGVAVEAGAIPKLIRLSASPDDHLSFSAISALRNIVGDSPSLRDRVDDEGGIDALARLLNRAETHPKVQRITVWAISSYLNPWLLDGLSVTKIKHLVPCLARYIQLIHLDEATTDDDKESIACAIHSLSRILDLGFQRSELIDAGVVPRLVHLLVDSSSNAIIKKRALKCIGYLFNGGDSEADAVVDAGLLPALLVTLDAMDEDLCKLALFHASNIAAGSQSQVYALLDGGLLTPIVRILINEQYSPRCRRDACWTLSNLTTKVFRDIKVGQAFLEAGCIEGLSAGLLIPDRKAKALAVLGIARILEWQDSQGSQAWAASLSTAIGSSSWPQNLRVTRDDRELQDQRLRNGCHILLTRWFPEQSRRARV